MVARETKKDEIERNRVVERCKEEGLVGRRREVPYSTTSSRIRYTRGIYKQNAYSRIPIIHLTVHPRTRLH